MIDHLSAAGIAIVLHVVFSVEYSKKPHKLAPNCDYNEHEVYDGESRDQKPWSIVDMHVFFWDELRYVRSGFVSVTFGGVCYGRGNVGRHKH
jgi:hypothetical protein